MVRKPELGLSLYIFVLKTNSTGYGKYQNANEMIVSLGCYIDFEVFVFVCVGVGKKNIFLYIFLL